jgi:hypothetical protein
MSGKAIIILVAGVIIITATIMYNIEAASTRIVKNFSDYYMRQNTQNIAQSGVNMAYTQLGLDRSWRAGFANYPILDGIVNVRVFNTNWDSIPAVGVESIAETDYGFNQKRRDTSTAYFFWSKKTYPIAVNGLITLNSALKVNGNSYFDGRDHDLNGNLITGAGVAGFWTTGAYVQVSGSSIVGGTASGADYAPANPPHAGVTLTSQTYPGGSFPQTPDSVLGGASATYPEGTLKSIAKSGYAGSQYVTDPSKLKTPLRGITYVEPPASSPDFSPAEIAGEGILVVHNSAVNATLKNTKGVFRGVIIADDIVHLHGDVFGAIIALTPNLSGNVLGNGNSNLLYSRAAILNAAKFLEYAGKPNILAWWE